MLKLKLTPISVIKWKYLKDLANTLHYSMGYKVSFSYDAYTFKDRYILLCFDKEEETNILRLLKEKLNKCLKNRITSSCYNDTSDLIHLSEEEFLELYNKLVLKNENFKITDITITQYKYKKSDYLITYNIDPLTIYNPISEGLRKSLNNFFEPLPISNIIVSSNEKIKEASIYILYDIKLEKSVNKWVESLRELKAIESTPISYQTNKKETVKQINLSTEQLYFLYGYLKLTHTLRAS